MGAVVIARHGANRHPEGDQGRTPASSAPISASDMGDIQAHFVHHDVRGNTRCPSHSITSPGKPVPIPDPMAPFTLAMAYHFVRAISGARAYASMTSRLSFFFSNGMDPEYTVMGRGASAHLEWRHGCEPFPGSNTTSRPAAAACAGDRLQRHPLFTTFSSDRNGCTGGIPTHRRGVRYAAMAIRLIISTADGD